MTPNRDKFHKEEIFLGLLFRLSHPDTLSDVSKEFGRSIAAWSRGIKAIEEYLVGRFGHLIFPTPAVPNPLLRWARRQ